MSGGSSVEHIDAADAFARNLYLRAKQSGLAFADVAAAVRQLHLALRHLRVESADPDSLLNRSNASVYARQLQPMIEDCDWTLKQLDTLLEKYGDARAPDDVHDRADRIAVIRSKLVTEKTNVDMFLDTVQLHNPANNPGHAVDGSQASLEGIKDKVDEIASRLFKRRGDNAFAEDEDGLWQEFKAELEKEGFAPRVLAKHKEVLRAYIREVESMSSTNGGTYPTVRGLLEHEANSRSNSPRNPVAAKDNEKYSSAMKDEKRMPSHAPRRPTSSSSSEDEVSDSNDSLALISTRDLMAMDNLNAGMKGLHLHPPSKPEYNLSQSAPPQRYLPSNVTGMLNAPPPSSELSSSPRFVPPFPPSAVGGRPLPPGHTSNASFRLAPDRYGHDIPAEAEWTRIRRTLVSPEVLERAGVRYEARPEYVAILGRLTREEVANFARQSAAARAARAPPRRRPDRHDRERERDRDRADSKSSRDDEDDDSDLFDESDSTDDDDDKTSEKGTKSYPYIVKAPDKNTSPASTVPPKPILKNKNENHVRFDPEPHEVESRSPRSLKDDRERRRDRAPPSSSRRYNRESSRRHSDSGGSGGERYRSERRGSNAGDHHSSSNTGGGSSSSRRHHRDRRGSRREERAAKKKAWGETLGAVGIGGAAVSLLSVLAEAASAV
ncbi:hypothetical protein G7046_g7034 [Stylonectria norvegica]|nr:hypothetical protein G7046_g7034 [Stylonectria norvegica]